jgi:hypothetical protein
MPSRIGYARDLELSGAEYQRVGELRRLRELDKILIGLLSCGDVFPIRRAIHPFPN